MTGSFLSNDAGESWRMFNLRSRAAFFAFDPLNPRTIYTGGRGLFRSTDGGATWNLIFPEPARVKGIRMMDDHAAPVILTGQGPAAQVSAFAVDPSDSTVLYTAAVAAGESTLYVSTDGGGAWKQIRKLQTGALKIYIDPRSPRNVRGVYVIGNTGAAVREKGAWHDFAAPAAAGPFRQVSGGFPPQGGRPVVYALGTTSLFISRDGGIHWEDSDPGMAKFVADGSLRPVWRAVGTCLTQPDVAYLSYHRMKLRSGGEELIHGVARTADAGRTWALVWQEGVSPAPNVREMWITERFGTDYSANPLSLGIAPNNPDIVYGTDQGRIMQSLDGGHTWLAKYSRRLPDHTYADTGLDLTTCYGVHFDPFDPKRMFISYTDIGLFGSENLGESWSSATIGVPPQWLNTTYWIEFDPEVRGRVWGVMARTHDLPRSKMWHKRKVADFDGGVCLSEDGARTWRRSSDGLSHTAPTHILLDPTSPLDARVLYVTGFGKGVFKSTDGGRSWQLRNNGIEGREPFAWRLTRDPKGVLYLVVARRSDDGSYGDEQDGALYRSRDGAGHWERLRLPKGVNGPNGIAIDPDNPERLYLAAWGRAGRDGAVDGGIFVSNDGGKTWRNTLAVDQHVYDITIDPRDVRTVYASGFESSAWRSTDRGESWRRIPGFNFKWGHRVIPDPHRAGMIYITTFGGSVWHGLAEGDPRAVEDIVTPALRYQK